MSGKLLLFDFRCESCNQTHEAMVDTTIRAKQCTYCSGHSLRLIPSPRMDPRLGQDPDSFPTMGYKWARKHKQARELDEKFHREHGPSADGCDGSDRGR